MSKPDKVKSEFLEELYYNNQGHLNRNKYTLRDIEGRRLPEIWGNGDTITSITLRRTKDMLIQVINPDTYTKKNFKWVKLPFYRKSYETYGIYFNLGFLMIVSPFLIYLPFLAPRLKKAKNDFFLHQFLKKKFLQEELKLGSKKMRLRDIKRILRNIDEKELQQRIKHYNFIEYELFV